MGTTLLRGEECRPIHWKERGALTLDRRLGSLPKRYKGFLHSSMMDGLLSRSTAVTASVMTGLGFFGKIAEIAEDQGHHPDLHLVGYHDVTIEMWTHTTNGLSINDFIVACLIDKLDTPPSPQS